MTNLNIRIRENEFYSTFSKDGKEGPSLHIANIFWMEPIRGHKGYKFENSCFFLSSNQPHELIKIKSYKLFLENEEIKIPKILLKRMITVILSPLLYKLIDCGRFIYYICSGDVVTVLNKMTKKSIPIELEDIDLFDIIAFNEEGNSNSLHIAIYIGNLSNGEHLFLNKLGIGDIGFCTLKQISKYIRLPKYKMEKIITLFDDDEKRSITFK